MTTLAWAYSPPWGLRNGLAMTLHMALVTHQRWAKTVPFPEPPYQARVFRGAGDVPIAGWLAIPPHPHGTIVGTYGITGSLQDQGILRVLGRKAYAMGYAIVLFDWRAHGQTALLSPVLTSDGLYEGDDFVQIALQAIDLGCPAPCWFVGYSLGGQLALWGAKAAEVWEQAQGTRGPIAGAAVICPNLDANRSLRYLEAHPWGRYLEQAIARNLKTLAAQIEAAHPGALDPAAIARATTIRGFDDALVIERLGFPSVEVYYDVTSPLHFLGQLQKKVLVLYAADDPLFSPALIPELQAIGPTNPNLDLVLTQYGGHVGYLADRATQQAYGDPDGWWAWNRILGWMATTT